MKNGILTKKKKNGVRLDSLTDANCQTVKPDPNSVAHAPSKPGQQEGRDGIAFFYNSEKVTLIKFIQSQDGSRPTHRRDFYVDLKLNEQRDTPVHFRIACTHLDSEKDLTIGNTQLSALVEDVLKVDNKKSLDFVVVCGDFNEGENESSRPRHEIMHNAGFFTDGSVETTRPEAMDVRHKGHVDWIYFKKLSTLGFDLISLSPIGDEKGSDHKLTLTDVEIK
jgi:endonuclease/exonuclease/phosphatase family metal-dependent hydrolase